jgi:hypothetical protein
VGYPTCWLWWAPKTRFGVGACREQHKIDAAITAGWQSAAWFKAALMN